MGKPPGTYSPKGRRTRRYVGDSILRIVCDLFRVSLLQQTIDYPVVFGIFGLSVVFGIFGLLTGGKMILENYGTKPGRELLSGRGRIQCSIDPASGRETGLIFYMR